MAAVDRSDEDIAANIEFSLVIEQRIINILLDYIGLKPAVWMRLLGTDNIINGLEVTVHCYASASVGDFSWLDNPYIFHFFLVFGPFVQFELS